MKKPKNSKAVSRIARARRRFDSWRERRGQGPRRIPEPLWRLAVVLAGRYGIHRTARSLGLNYTTLKERAAECGALRPDAKPAFVELVPTGAPLLSGSLIELERSGGAKLRIQCRAGEQLDAAAIVRSFCEAGA